MSERYSEEVLVKSLKFVMKTNKQQSDILEKMTAKHTFAIRKAVKILINENFKGTSNELEQLVIPSKNRSNPKYNMKQETGMNYSDVKWCVFKALEMWKSYNYDLTKWEKRSEFVSEKIITKMLAMININHTGKVILNETDFNETIDGFSKLRINRRLKKNKPSLPFSSYKYKNKKIPMRFMYNTNLLGFSFQDDKLLLKISTLKRRKPIAIELEYGNYQKLELDNCRVTGGQIIKNLQKKHWEFIASVRKDISNSQNNRIKKKKAILGVDLGIVTDATVVVLIEKEKLAYERFHFIKEPLLRKKKFNIQKRKRILQQLIEKTSGNKRKQFLHELKQLNSSYVKVSNEACHKIAKRIMLVAKDYLEGGFDVHIAIGRLTGLKRSISKGDDKSKKFRGRINKFPYQKLTEFIHYKCQEIGIRKQNIRNIQEKGTSKTCH